MGNADALNHPLQCRCGMVRGRISAQRVNRVICYCRDCQAFAHFLGGAAEILDARGGTDVVQATPADVTFSAGLDSLACVRLSEKGLLRWYAKCCNTPIGNTVIDYRFSFVGLIHNCLDSSGPSLQESFGPVRMWSFTKSATQPVKANTPAMIGGILRFLGMVIRARVSGAYRRSPFFADGIPIAAPKVLSATEREAVYEAVDAKPA